MLKKETREPNFVLASVRRAIPGPVLSIQWFSPEPKLGRSFIPGTERAGPVRPELLVRSLPPAPGSPRSPRTEPASRRRSRSREDADKAWRLGAAAEVADGGRGGGGLGCHLPGRGEMPVQSTGKDALAKAAAQRSRPATKGDSASRLEAWLQGRPWSSMSLYLIRSLRAGPFLFRSRGTNISLGAFQDRALTILIVFVPGDSILWIPSVYKVPI
ncbi:unnamed protein product [Rangifer tarandus platyrhynchus]|uniref:Uncharacterized protein n=1 Tax=Rangifer tarandus platyrhynchus TaxID=3082113 RepID=A0ABN8YWF4_RANTA|nr:unnamed protein product [Rangifer tarandus platyrhynchus]